MHSPRSARRYCCAYKSQPDTFRPALKAYRLLPTALGLLVVVLCSPGFAIAQSSTATLSGTVHDPNSAVVAGANVALVYTSQGTQRLDTTNKEGRFFFQALTPGQYSLTVTANGFAPQTKNVVVSVNDDVSVRIELTVNPVSQTVDVTDVAPLISELPAVNRVIDRDALKNLPISVGNIQPLIFLSPGVTIAPPTAANPGQFSSNGQRTNSNGFFVDGAGANISVPTGDTLGQQSAGALPALTSFGGTSSLISIDALQEFSIQTSTFSPEFGRSPGAQISLVSRAGTQDFHGTFFEYLRNDKLDANDYFANRAGLRAALRHNQFGFVVGGPIILPRFGEGGKAWRNGREHSFFFFSYEGLRLRQPQTVITSVPSLRVRALAPANVRFLVNSFPLPTGAEVGTTGRSPFTGVYTDQASLNATSFRIDHNFSSNFTIFGRFNNAPSDSVNRLNTTTQPPNNVVALDLGVTTLTVGSTQSFNSQFINEVRVNYSRTSGERNRTLDNYGGAVPVTLADLVPAFALRPHSAAEIRLFNLVYSIGDLLDNVQRQLNIIDNVTYTRGLHSFKFGIDYRRLTPVFQAKDFNLVAQFNTEAAITSGRFTNAFVQLQKRTEPVFNNFSAYFQDVFRPANRTVLTYGVRWDVNPPPSDANNSPFALTSSDPLTAQVASPGTPLWKTTWLNFAPRVGISYRLFDNPGRELVLRGGVGLFHDLGNTQAGDAFTRGPFTAATRPVVTNQPYPLVVTPASLPSYPTNGLNASQTNASDPNLKQPYTWQWNLTLEQSLGTKQTISAGYVAAVGRRLLRPRFIALRNPNFSNLNFTDNGAKSDYHSLQVQFNRRLSRNFQALASYTWAHSIDDISDETAMLIAARGNSDFDIRHNFSSALQYDIPFERKGWAGALFNNWHTSLIIHAQSAYPLTPILSSFSIITGLASPQWPNVKEGVPLYISDPLVPGGRRINRAAFSAPAAGTQGNVGRNSLRGFPSYQFDAALQRDFALGEGWTLSFRGEAFNLFNHPNFGLPDADLNGIFFGQSTKMLVRNLGGLSPIYQMGGPRSIQLGIRLNF